MRPQTEKIRKAEALWSQFGPAVVRTLMSYERDADLQQDLAQDVFLAVLASIDRIESAGNPRAYVFRIAHNVAVDHVAKASKANWVEFEQELPDVQADPARDADASHERERLLRAIRKLRLPYRQVTVLLLEGFEHSEIAEILGIRSGTVRIRVVRARARLKELLDHD